MINELTRKILLIIASLFQFFIAGVILLYTYNGRAIMLSEKLVLGIIILLFGLFLIYTGIQTIRGKLWAITTGFWILAISLFFMLAGIGFKGGWNTLSASEINLLIVFFVGIFLHGFLGSMGIFKLIKN